MLNNQGQAAEAAALLHPQAATATVNSGWIDARKYEGDLVLSTQIGAMTGSAPTCAFTVEDATDGAGTGAAAVTPNEGSFAAGAANQIQKRTINASAVRGWIRLTATIGGTTPSVTLAANLKSHPKYST